MGEPTQRPRAAGAPPDPDRMQPRRLPGSRRFLFAVAVLPMLLLAAAAWSAWTLTWREARSEMTHVSEAGAEYALRVLSAHAVAAGRVDAILRGFSDATIRANEQALHEELQALVAELPQAEAAYVVDRDGRALVGASIFPVPRDQAPARDRDFFVALSAPDAPAVHVSQVHASRFDGGLFFAVSRRRTRTGNPDADPQSFDGLVNLSLYPNRIAEGLGRLVTTPGDTLSLVREDGEVLARNIGQSTPLRLAPASALAGFVARGAERGLFETVSSIDGQPRLFAMRRVEGWPVYAIAGRPREAITAAWRRTVSLQLVLGVPASMLLFGLTLLVLRGQDRLFEANAGLEQRVAERTAALAESEQRLQQALGSGRVFAFDLDITTDAALRSPNAAAILGLAPERAERDTVRQFLDAVPQEDRERLDATLAALSPAAPSYALRYRYHRPDGSLVWLQEEGAGHFDAQGRLLRLTGLSHDVTAEAEAERQLRESEARMRELLDTLDLGPAMVRDPDGTIRFWSKGCEQLLGWSAAEAVGRVAHALLETVYPEPLPAIEAQLARRGEWSGDLVKTTRNGRKVVVAARLALRRNPETGAASVLEVLADVTAHRAAEAALAEREAEFRAMFEGTAVGMVQTDAETGRFLRVNHRFCDMVGYPEAALTGELALADLIHPEDRARDMITLQVALAGAEPFDLTTRLLRRDGGTIWAAVQMSQVRGQAGRAARTVAVVRDVTERRRHEEQRELMTRELDHRAKNALAVVQAALRLTPKTDAAAYARAIEGRVAALARAHTLLAQGRWEGAALRALLEAEMASFLLSDGAAGRGEAPRVTASGPDLTLAPAAVQALSMALHELATNATKYGALSVPGGRVAVSWSEDVAAGLLRLRWVECGGPPLHGPPERRGFGSRVIEATLRDQLGGTITRRWEPEGLVCDMALPLARVAGARLAGAA